jgi:hypothetical protein
MKTILRYSCAALLALTFTRATADDPSAGKRRDDLQPLPSWNGVIPSLDTTRGPAEPTIEVSASMTAGELEVSPSTSVAAPSAGTEHLASWTGEVPESSSAAGATVAEHATDARLTQQLPSWNGIVPSLSAD